MTTYSELRLRIDRGVTRGSYRIVATGPAGEALGRFKLPFADLELENFILRIGSTRRGRRRIDSPEMELAKTFGTKLFGALFEGDVRELYRSSLSESRADGRGLRVTLSLTGAPELLQVPWEYLYDHPSFLSISTWTPIVRYLDLPKPRRPLQIELPLRILGLVSAPSDFETIDAAQERAKLETALAPLIEAGAIEIDWLEEASLRALQRQLRKVDYHVFHYIGHGGYDDAADDGVLLFEDEQGRGRRVSGVQLGTILADEVSLRLAVLNSCEGGRSSLQDPFSGVATSLIEREIPAVIGMQFEITDRAAIVFGGEFYAALADGLAVDSAVAEARKAIYADQNDIEWGTPVLFMRVADGRLFDVNAHAPVRAAVQADDAPVAADAELAPKDAPESDEAAEADRVEQERLRREAAAVAASEAARIEQERMDREAADASRSAAAAEAERVERDRAESARLQREADERAERERTAAAASIVSGEIADSASPEAHAEGAPATAVDHSTAPVAAPPRLARPALRALIGAPILVVLGWVIYYASPDNSLPDDVSELFGPFIGEAVVVTAAMVLAVCLAEYLWPAARVPEGRAYRFVGGNRWLAAAIQGAIVAVTVGFVVTVLFNLVVRDISNLFLLEVAIPIAAYGAIGFLIGEVVVSLSPVGRQTPASLHTERPDGGN